MDTRKEKRKTASHEIRERSKERCNDQITKGQQYHHITNDAMVSRVITITRRRCAGGCDDLKEKKREQKKINCTFAKRMMTCFSL